MGNVRAGAVASRIQVVYNYVSANICCVYIITKRPQFSQSNFGCVVPIYECSAKQVGAFDASPTSLARPSANNVTKTGR
eukprot:8774182-Karenia_brevis.AAC.1